MTQIKHQMADSGFGALQFLGALLGAMLGLFTIFIRGMWWLVGSIAGCWLGLMGMIGGFILVPLGFLLLIFSSSYGTAASLKLIGIGASWVFAFLCGGAVLVIGDALLCAIGRMLIGGGDPADQK